MSPRSEPSDFPELGTSAVDRLPAGRHRIPPQEVQGHQHRRLLEATTALCAERGYAHVTISDIVARAAVSKQTFYRFFESKDACLFATHKHYSATLLARIDSSCTPTAPWPEALRAGVRAALEFCSQNAAASQLLGMGILSCGPEGALRYRTTIEAIASRLSTRSPGSGPEFANAALAAAAFAVPLIGDSLGGEDSTEMIALESALVELVLSFSDSTA
jgi:AcrR family transcriptional regulator